MAGIGHDDALAAWHALGGVVRNDAEERAVKFTSRDRQTSIATRAEAEIVIGSGQLGKSYLCIRDGSVWQSGISWFSKSQIWDISPGFKPGTHGTRAIQPGCFYCHVNRVEHIAGTINRYEQPTFGMQTSIGCERCHGPGELHVNEQHAFKPTVVPDTSIVNPKHLEPGLRDAGPGMRPRTFTSISGKCAR